MKMKKTLAQYRRPLALAAAVLAPLGIAAVLVPFRAVFANTAAALVIVAVVVAVAVAGDRLAGVVATVSGSLWFDFFLTRPYDHFSIRHRGDIETTVSLFVVGVVVTELAVRNRRHREAADENLDFVAGIYGLAELAAGDASAEDVLERAKLELIALLLLQGCRYEPGRSSRRNARIEHNGEVVYAGRPRDARHTAEAGEEIELDVESAGCRSGTSCSCPILIAFSGQPSGWRRWLSPIRLVQQWRTGGAPPEARFSFRPTDFDCRSNAALSRRATTSSDVCVKSR